LDYFLAASCSMRRTQRRNSCSILGPKLPYPRLFQRFANLCSEKWIL
jgi:hypothetical protein